MPVQLQTRTQPHPVRFSSTLSHGHAPHVPDQMGDSVHFGQGLRGPSGPVSFLRKTVLFTFLILTGCAMSGSEPRVENTDNASIFETPSVSAATIPDSTYLPSLTDVAQYTEEAPLERAQAAYMYAFNSKAGELLLAYNRMFDALSSTGDPVIAEVTRLTPELAQTLPAMQTQLMTPYAAGLVQQGISHPAQFTDEAQPLTEAQQRVLLQAYRQHRGIYQYVQSMRNGRNNGFPERAALYEKLFGSDAEIQRLETEVRKLADETRYVRQRSSQLEGVPEFAKLTPPQTRDYTSQYAENPDFEIQAPAPEEIDQIATHADVDRFHTMLGRLGLEINVGILDAYINRLDELQKTNPQQFEALVRPYNTNPNAQVFSRAHYMSLVSTRAFLGKQLEVLDKWFRLTPERITQDNFEADPVTAKFLMDLYGMGYLLTSLESEALLEVNQALFPPEDPIHGLYAAAAHLHTTLEAVEKKHAEVHGRGAEGPEDSPFKNIAADVLEIGGEATSEKASAETATAEKTAEQRAHEAATEAHEICVKTHPNLPGIAEIQGMTDYEPLLRTQLAYYMAAIDHYVQLGHAYTQMIDENPAARALVVEGFRFGNHRGIAGLHGQVAMIEGARDALVNTFGLSVDNILNPDMPIRSYDATLIARMYKQAKTMNEMLHPFAESPGIIAELNRRAGGHPMYWHQFSQQFHGEGSPIADIEQVIGACQTIISGTIEPRYDDVGEPSEDFFPRKRPGTGA